MAIAWVRDGGQGSDGELTNSAGSLSVTVNTPAAGHAAGNTIVLRVGWRLSGGAMTVTDTQGNTYVQRVTDDRNFCHVAIYTAYLATGLSLGDSITVTNDAASALEVTVTEFSGVHDTDPVDVTNVNEGDATNATVVCPTTSGAGRMLVAGMLDASPSTGSGASISSGWTAENGAVWDYGGSPQRQALFRAHRGPVAAGSYTATWTYGGLKPYFWVAAVAALQESPASPSAPTAPDGLTATALSESAIELDWNDNSSNEDGFRIERSLDAVTWAEITTVAAGVATYTNTGLTAGTLYYYRVRAYNSGGGNSAYSNTASATTDASDTPTTVPSDPTECSAIGIGESRIRVSWLDNAVDEDGYKVEISSDGLTGWRQFALTGPDAFTVVASGLSPATTYYFRVRAYNVVGNSGYSNVASAETLEEGEGEGVCPVTPYATVANVQARIWTSHIAIGDGSEPGRADVEDWLCETSLWIDSTLEWCYSTPITNAGDREILREVCAGMVAARVWRSIVSRNPGQEDREKEQESEALSRLVYMPSGFGSKLKGSSAVLVASNVHGYGRSLIVLPGTPRILRDTQWGESPASSFTDPDGETGPARFFSRTKEM